MFWIIQIKDLELKNLYNRSFAQKGCKECCKAKYEANTMRSTDGPQSFFMPMPVNGHL